MSYKDWPIEPADPLKLRLDDKNPRISDGKANQAQLRERLFSGEDAIAVAHDVVRAGGLFPHDIIIVTKERGKHVVLEGNRRVAAIQCLLKPRLIPPGFENSFPKADEALATAIKDILVVEAPSRQAADPIIARIHAFSARKQWAPLAKWRYAHSNYTGPTSVLEIAGDLHATPSEVRKFIRRYRIYEYIMGLSWSDEERERLSSDSIPVTSLVYPFELSGVRDLVGNIFDQHGDLVSKIDKDILNASLKKLARDALIPLEPSGKYYLTTRGTADGSILDYFTETHKNLISEFVKAKKAQSKGSPSSAAGSGEKGKGSEAGEGGTGGSNAGRRKKKAAEFFEDFSIPANSPHKMLKLSEEITSIKYGSFPIAAAMLLRALLEETLREHLVRARKFSDFKGRYATQGLKSMILYCSASKNAVFADGNIGKQLSRFQNSAVKDDLDNVVHNEYGAINKETLLKIKPYVRPIIENIALKEWV